MKRIKYLLLIIVIFLFAGCSGDYNLTLNRDLSVEEELNVLLDNKNDDVYEKTYKLFNDAGISEDKYEMVVKDDKVHIIYKEKYSTFEEYYLNSHLYKMLFEEIAFSKDNTGMVITTEAKFKLNDKDNQNIVNSYNIDKLNINLKLPFDVNKSNADSIKEDVYTWELNSDDTFKNINIDYSYKNDRVQNVVVLVTIGIASLIILGFIIINLVRNKRL